MFFRRYRSSHFVEWSRGSNGKTNSGPIFHIQVSELFPGRRSLAVTASLRSSSLSKVSNTEFHFYRPTVAVRVLRTSGPSEFFLLSMTSYKLLATCKISQSNIEYYLLLSYTVRVGSKSEALGSLQLWTPCESAV